MENKNHTFSILRQLFKNRNVFVFCLPQAIKNFTFFQQILVQNGIKIYRHNVYGMILLHLMFGEIRANIHSF